MSIRRLLLGVVTLWSVLLANESSAEGSAKLAIEALKSGGHVALMRHALAPGTGDPTEFALTDCATQRNLNDVGRVQAKATGDFLKKHNIEFASVYSSQWCRCMETAQLLGVASVIELPQINSFFQQMHESTMRTDALREWLLAQNTDQSLLLVTHQVNITALSGVYPRSGELVIGKLNAGGEFSVIGTIDPL